ncbi:DUF262 domain-containing protein [Clavibacter tessellarius]|uniref:DUF262 domain-containing protein n=1 Tax=Clavibacter tessellarius TaxID=31965 RepID=UPI0009BE579D|nr:DUF262 domain-containing protein [Clavibacter michiganensis]
MATLNSESARVGDFFSQQFFFEIPNYQRPFSWEKDQISDLIDDLLDADRSSDYFLGTLVLHEKSQATYAVVDGQQRLTAIAILLATIRDLLEEDSDHIQQMLAQPEIRLRGIEARSRLVVRNSAPYEAIVNTPGGTRLGAPVDALITSVENRYRQAVLVFQRALAELDQESLASFASFVIQRVVFIYLAASTFDDAFRLFTVVNDRGIQLRRIDVLKAMNLSPDAIRNNTTREEYAHKWEDLEELLGADSFENLFSALRLVYVQDKPEGDLLHEFESRIYGKPKRPAAGVTFIDILSEYVHIYEALFTNRDYLSGTSDHVRYSTLMYSMSKEFRASEWRACVLAFAHKFKTDKLYEFVLRIETLYVKHWVSGMRKDERYASYTAILKTIESEKSGSGVVTAMEYDVADIREACRRANFYGAGYAKYLLIRAEMQAAELDTPRQFLPRSIEHVLPQNPASTSQWKADFTDEEIAELVHSVGNLVLLSKAKNSSAQNKDFIDKKRTYLTPRVSDYPRSLMTVGAEHWTPEVVRQRTNDFAATIMGTI